MNSASARLSNVVRSARSGLVLVERHLSLGKTHKICSLELITEEWWLCFLELEKNFLRVGGVRTRLFGPPPS